VIPRKGKPGKARQAVERRQAFRRTVKWRTGCEGRISTLKRGYGWDRTRIDGTEGARIWTGHGVLAHNLVKIAALTDPVSKISTPGVSGPEPAASISTPGVRVVQRNGFRDTYPLGGDPWWENDDRRTASTPEVSFGPFVPPRFGRPSTPLAAYPRLVIASLIEWGTLATAIPWIAVTRQRIHTAGGLVPRTLRISGTLADLAGQAAADAQKVLVNARRALHRAVDNLTQLPVTSTTTAFRGTVKWRTRVPVPRSTPATGTPTGPHRIERDGGTRTWTGHRILAHNLVNIAGPTEKPGIQDQQLRRTPQIANRGHLSGRPPTLSGASS